MYQSMSEMSLLIYFFIKEMTGEERQMLFSSSLSSTLTMEQIESVPVELRGLLYVLEYWCNKESVTLAHVYAILLAR